MNNDSSQINPLVRGWFNQNSQPDSTVNPMVRGWFNSSDASPHPLDDTAVTKAQSDSGDQSYNNYCETFVEKAAGLPNMGNTAAEAWNNYAQQGRAVAGDVSTAPRGALIYFQPSTSNFGEGHTGIADGQGNFVSATSQGVKSMPISQWIEQTKQTPSGYVIPQGGQQ